MLRRPPSIVNTIAIGGIPQGTLRKIILSNRPIYSFNSAIFGYPNSSVRPSQQDKTIISCARGRLLVLQVSNGWNRWIKATDLTRRQKLIRKFMQFHNNKTLSDHPGRDKMYSDTICIRIWNGIIFRQACTTILQDIQANVQFAKLRNPGIAGKMDFYNHCPFLMDLENKLLWIMWWDYQKKKRQCGYYCFCRSFF